MNIDLMELKEFLTTARKNTFAGEGEEAESTRPNTTRYVYVEGDWTYEDEYVAGDEDFMGWELVSFKGKPCWGMVYNGGVDPVSLNKFGLEVGDVYRQLKTALSEKADHVRIGGSEVIRKGGFWVYEDRPNKASKELVNFIGTEELRYRRVQVYGLFYSGGLIHWEE